MSAQDRQREAKLSLNRNFLSFAAVLATISLTGCISHSSSEVVTAMSSQMQADSFVSEVRLTSLPPNVSPEFAPTFTAALKTAMAGCTAGKHPLRLEVAVEKFNSQNAAMTILVGSSNKIEGSAKLIEPTTNAVVGDYDIVRSTGGGGIIAAIGMSGAEEKMASAFASDVCKKAFGTEPRT